MKLLKVQLMNVDELELCTASESTIALIVITQELELILLSLFYHVEKNLHIQLLFCWLTTTLNYVIVTDY